MEPEEILQQQADVARAIQQEKKIVPELPATDAIVVDFDADIGSDVLQLSDGSIRYANPVTNGVRATGDTVLLHQGEGAASCDALPHIKKRRSVIGPKVLTTYPFKILFSVVEDGVRKFYVGGDRSSPTLLFSDPENRIFNAYFNNIGKNKSSFINTTYGENISLDYNNPEKNWLVSGIPAQYLQWCGYGFLASSLISPGISRTLLPEVITGDLIKIGERTYNYAPLLPSGRPPRRQDIIVYVGSNTLGYFDAANSPKPVFSGNVRQLATYTYSGISSGNVNTDYLYEEFRSSGMYSLPASTSFELPECNENTQGTVIKKRVALPLFEAIERKTETETYSGVPQSFAAFNKEIVVKNGNLVYNKNVTDSIHYKMNRYDSSVTFRCQCYIVGTFFESKECSWDYNIGNFDYIEDFENTIGKETNEFLQESGEVAIFPSVYLPYINTITRQIIYNSGETGTWTGGFYYSDSTLSNNTLNTTSMSAYRQEFSKPEPIYISELANFSIYTIKTYLNSLNATGGTVNYIKSLETTVEIKNNRYEYYLYDHRKGQHIKINDLPTFEWYIGNKIDIQVGYITLQSGNNGGVYEQLKEVITTRSTYNPNNFQRTSQFETIDLPFWQQFVGMTVVLTQIENDNFIQGIGTVTAYTFADYQRSNGDIDRESLTVTIDIQSVNNVDFDEYAVLDTAVLYNVGTIERVSIPSSNITFKENTNIASPILGTLYKYLTASVDLHTTTRDVPGYCVAYDLIKDNNSHIQVLPRSKSISGIIKNLKANNNRSLQIYGVSYYPPR